MVSDVKKGIKREFVSDNGLDQLEHQWWNDNAAIIAKVWEMHDDVSWTVRRRYIRKAKDFILDPKRNATVLELGCGSGWVGQMLASPELNILGTDFSISQIKLAEENANRKGLRKFCKYMVSTSDKWPKEFNDVDGVLIHCFLHHLSGKELEDILLNLKSNLRKGTKIWIYEPAFHLRPGLNKKGGGTSMHILLAITTLLLSVLEKVYSRFNLLDQSLVRTFSQLTNKAEHYGWYLTPKEIPFDVDEFSDQLNMLFVVDNSYWATINLVGEVQRTNMLKSPQIRKFVNKFFLPLFAFTDSKLCKDAIYLSHHLVAPIYAFRVWECIIR